VVTRDGPGASDVKARRARRIQVMISSRNKDSVRLGPGRKRVKLLDVRRALKEELEEMTFCGQKLLKVYINEDGGGESGTDTIWDTCRQKLDESQIIIAIYNGHAGWCREEAGLGICHEEIKYVLDHYPAKLYLIELKPTTAESAADRAFAGFMKGINRWREQAHDVESLKESVRLAVAKAVSDLTVTGSREGRKGRYYFGSPLGWARLGYLERKIRIEEAVARYLVAQGAWSLPVVEPEDTPGLVWRLEDAQVLLLVHGVPSSFGIAEAREMVGRPYLSDHQTPVAASGGLLVGPVHLVACHRSCTESRILSYMGHPDVYIVQTPFGFFAADLTSFVQTFFLTDCRDRDATVMAMERMFEWIAEANEGGRIVERARSRQRILRTVRGEIEAQSGPRQALPAIFAEIEEATNPLAFVLEGILEPETALR
jgi:hypothetical protein